MKWKKNYQSSARDFSHCPESRVRATDTWNILTPLNSKKEVKMGFLFVFCSTSPFCQCLLGAFHRTMVVAWKCSVFISLKSKQSKVRWPWPPTWNSHPTSNIMCGVWSSCKEGFFQASFITTLNRQKHNNPFPHVRGSPEDGDVRVVVVVAVGLPAQHVGRSVMVVVVDGLDHGKGGPRRRAGLCRRRWIYARKTYFLIRNGEKTEVLLQIPEHWYWHIVLATPLRQPSSGVFIAPSSPICQGYKNSGLLLISGPKLYTVPQGKAIEENHCFLVEQRKQQSSYCSQVWSHRATARVSGSWWSCCSQCPGERWAPTRLAGHQQL